MMYRHLGALLRCHVTWRMRLLLRHKHDSQSTRINTRTQSFAAVLAAERKPHSASASPPEGGDERRPAHGASMALSAQSAPAGAAMFAAGRAGPRPRGVSVFGSVHSRHVLGEILSAIAKPLLR